MSLSGAFITVEGGEGTGKSTVVARLVADLTEAGVPALATREPGGSPIGAQTRAILLAVDGPVLDARTEALLMAADRAEHAAAVIRPAMENGVTVVSDRYLDSSVAYQGMARGLGAQHVRDLSVWAVGGLLPDLTVLLDVEPEIGLERRFRSGAGEVNRLDLEDIVFHRMARSGFLWAAEREPDRFRVIGAGRPFEAVYADVWHCVAEHLMLGRAAS